MALDFPSSPTDGQTYGEYTYNATLGVWRASPVIPGGLPAGTIMAWGGANAPSNWLICDGTAVSRSTYASLWNVLSGGTGSSPYGNGDGSTTFNLPDLRGKIPVGNKAPTSLGTATITIAAPGVVSLAAHGLATGQIVYFTTTGALPTGITANTRYWASVTATGTFNLATSLDNAIAGTVITTSGTQSGTHTLWRSDFDLGQISGEDNHKLTISELASHSHQFRNAGLGALNTTPSNWDDVVGASTNALGVGPTNPEETAANAIQPRGGGVAHNNLQPYQVVNYIIKYSGANTPGDSALALRVGALETADATTNKAGLVPVSPSSVVVNSGTGSVTSGIITVSGASIVKLVGLFSSTYSNYRVIIDWGKTSVVDNFFFAMLSGTTPSTVTHSYQAVTVTSGTVASSQSGNVAFVHFGVTSSSYSAQGVNDRYASAAIDIHSPLLPTITSFTFQSGSEDATNLIHRSGGGKHYTAASYDGLQFYTQNSSLFSATIQVYGYR